MSVEFTAEPRLLNMVCQEACVSKATYVNQTFIYLSLFSLFQTEQISPPLIFLSLISEESRGCAIIPAVPFSDMCYVRITSRVSKELAF